MWESKQGEGGEERDPWESRGGPEQEYAKTSSTAEKKLGVAVAAPFPSGPGPLMMSQKGIEKEKGKPVRPSVRPTWNHRRAVEA